jgi:hypothetical protein
MEYKNNELHRTQVALPAVQIFIWQSEEQFPVINSASRFS